MIRRTGRYVPRSTWTALNCRLLTALTAVGILGVAVSLLTLSVGAPDGFIPVAIATVGVFLVGPALARLLERFERSGVPVLESPPAAAGGRCSR